MRILRASFLAVFTCISLFGCAIETGSYYRVSASQGRIGGDRAADINSPVAITFDRGPDVAVTVQSIRKLPPKFSQPTLNIVVLIKRKTAIQINWSELKAVAVTTGKQLPIIFIGSSKAIMTASGFQNTPMPLSSSIDECVGGEYYYFGFEFINGVSAKFDVTFPSLWVNGTFYPSLVLHYEKTSGFRIMM